MRSDRALKYRLEFELDDVRQDLLKLIVDLKPEEFEFVPRADVNMKTVRAILEEIGAMEIVCVHLLIHGTEKNWEEAEKEAAFTGHDPNTAIQTLNQVRSQTLEYLQTTTNEILTTPISLPESWHTYFSSPVVEPEELLRWVARHEYYHVGQLITYKWILGRDPHKS